ncbi:MAG: enoyl-CoA hydratase/isomerase family protein [Promethearchaeota archaeon]|nr:MAG: enoyl-CoA hydratase/isomerase family protein [Candidatus Lokiarchaeota archaeon]
MTSNNFDFGEFIEFSITKRFGLITLNRVKRANAITLEMAKNLKKAIEYCQNNQKIRGLILTGNGSTFTTGMDMNFIDGSDHGAVKGFEKTAADIATLLYNGKPAICAINGRAMGDGVAYALCSDYRIAVKDSFFQMPEVKSGIFPGAGNIVLMSRILGIPWTKRILMFAQKVSSEKALDIGLIDQIVDDREELMEETMRMARFLFTKNQFILNGIKLCSNHLMDKSYREAYEIEKEFLYSWVDSKNKEDALNEFRKKFE